MSNCFFSQRGNKAFRQIFVTCIRWDPARLFENVFLYYYKKKRIKQIRKVNIRRERTYVNTFRFIDDLIMVSDGGEFISLLNLQKENGKKSSEILSAFFCKKWNF